VLELATNTLGLATSLDLRRLRTVNLITFCIKPHARMVEKVRTQIPRGLMKAERASRHVSDAPIGDIVTRAPAAVARDPE
jgi:peptidase E